MKNKQRGFIALISSLILGAIMIVFALSAGTSSYFARADSLSTEFLVQTEASSNSCLQIALKSIASAPNPLTYIIQNKTLAVDSNATCTIESITHNNTSFVILVKSTTGNSYLHKTLWGHSNSDLSITIDQTK